ncbi:MAG TPA: LytTR family DNA-binding domain-containing protein [Flavisolibacter sp.]|nr:LytTR family DNA-binding domain-containing protein [Flavisolibacter sp.]
MKLRCLLIDDEPMALKVLQSHIAQIDGLEVAGLCRNAVDAIKVLHQKTVDVLFLDIKMPMIIGTDFLRNLSHPPKVIFVTAFRDYAVEGFELNAVDYLVKPVSFERFLKAVDKLQRSDKDKKPFPDEQAYHSNPGAFVYLKAEKAMQKVFVQDIVYVESWKDYVQLYFKGGKKLLVKQSISAMEHLLSEHQFIRVHRSYIVSLEKVTGYTSAALTLPLGEIPIGRLYKQAVMNHLVTIL